MSAEIPAELRQLVFERAGGRCEYCRLPQTAAGYKHQPDHIIPRQHEGQTTANNLALACIRCNRYKGPNIGSLDPETGELVRFYHPRTQVWKDHFQLDGPTVCPLTPQARVTVKILRLNEADRVEERQRLMEVDLYP